MGRFLIEIWLLRGFLAFESIFGIVVAVGSIFCTDLGFGSSFRFRVEFWLLGGFFAAFWLLGRVLAIGSIFCRYLAFGWIFSV